MAALYTWKKRIQKGIVMLKNQGPRAVARKVYHVLVSDNARYETWIRGQLPTAEELEQQKARKFEYAPKISVIVPTYNTPERYLREMLESVLAQSYENWELCIADGSQQPDVETVVREYQQGDSRILYQRLSENYGIAENTNKALEMAAGEYIALFDHDDLLTGDALYCMVEALQRQPYDLLYSDEDMVDGKSKHYFKGYLKPDFSIDLLRAGNYITHLVVFKRALLEKTGMFRREFDGAQDYDMLLRLVEQAEHIYHVPRVLYHWRNHKNSTSQNPKSKLYAYEAGRRALEEHYRRLGISAAVEHTSYLGIYKTNMEIIGKPLVSIVIPNKDHASDLEKCVQSILQRNTYPNIELVIIENNSTEPETFAYYEKLKSQYSQVKVVVWEGGFNYSAINNFGVREAVAGEYLLFLNNDTELINPESISEMLQVCQRSDVGAVGAKLLYGDKTIQHCGVVIGFGGYAGHVFHGMGPEELGYMLRNQVNSNFSAVTAACMMTARETFERVGGFSEELVVAGNDVDYCLKVRACEKLVVCVPHSLWYHYESKSRGYEDTPEKKARFEREVAIFRSKWMDILEQGDPFYNPNFPMDQAPFTLPRASKTRASK